MDAVEAKGFWGHFNGTMLKPMLSSAPTDKEIKAKNQWDKDERSAKTLLAQKLPDSTVMEIHLKRTVKEQWEAVVKEYTQKGVYMQMELRAKFLTLRCPEKDNAKDFLRGLQLKKGGIGASGSEDQRQRLHLYHHFLAPRCIIQLCFVADGLDYATNVEVNRCKHLDDNAIAGSRPAIPKNSER